MRVTLVSPPVADPTLPVMSLPVLAAACRHKGHEATVYDLAIESLQELTEPRTIERSIDAIRRRLACRDMQPAGNRSFQAEAAVALALGSHTLAGVIGAKLVLRSEKFYDYSRYKAALQVLRNALRIHSAAFFPTKVDLDDYQIGGRSTFESIRRHLECEDENVFLAYIRQVALPRIIDSRPDAVGVSITYRAQLLAGLTLIQELRRYDSSVPIVVGGAFITSLGNRLAFLGDMLDAVTALVLFEGETALQELLARLEAGKSIDGIPNVVRPAQVRAGRIPAAAGFIEDLAALPAPDFCGIPLSMYLVPEPVLPVQTCRACYWGKCNFCGVSRATAGRYRVVPKDALTRHLDDLNARYACRHFFVCDDATSPSTLRSLADHVLAGQRDYRWCTEARFERSLTRELCSFLRRGGCVHLLFGFESAVPRVLSLMAKGTDPTLIQDVLTACRDADIAVNLQCFIGFPGETAEEAKETANFLRRNRPLYTSFAMGHYRAVTGSNVVRAPAEFGVTLRAHPPGETEIETWHRFTVQRGLSSPEAKDLSERLFADLAGDDMVGPGLLFGSSGAHGLLYSARKGRKGIDALGVETFRWSWDIETDRFKACEEADIIELDPERHLVVDTVTGNFQELDASAVSAFRRCQREPLSLPEACAPWAEAADCELEDIAETMAALVRLARAGILRSAAV